MIRAKTIVGSSSQRVLVAFADSTEATKVGLILQSLGHLVVGRATTGLDVLRLISLCRPSLLVLDLDLPDLEGLGVLRLLRRSPEGVAALVVTDLDPGVYVPRSMRLGAAGYLSKDDIGMLSSALESLACGCRFFPANFDQAEMSNMMLSDRELVTLRTLARGDGRVDVASALMISLPAVDTLCTRLRKKLGLNSIGALGDHGRRLGLV